MNSSLPLMHLILFFLFLLPSLSTAQTGGGNVTIGASLTAKNDSSSWISLSGDFAFGFQPLESNNDLFLLSIWYNKIPEKTIVWYANGDKPTPAGSKVVLTSDKGLILTTSQGAEIWRSQNNMVAVSRGVMKDTGNFVLLDANSSSLWESFKNPTDTLLPSQVFGKNGTLSSKQSKTDFSRGRFQLRLQQDGNLVMNTINLPGIYANEPYYATGTTGDSDPMEKGRELVFNESGYLYVVKENGQLYSLSKGGQPSVTKFYHRATLDPDGIFALYTYSKDFKENETWNLLLSLPDNICTNFLVSEGLGVCGYNSICKIGSGNRPTCECPEGYKFLDPNNRFSSCTPDFEMSCQDAQRNSSEVLFTFNELINTDWPTSDYILLKPITEDNCRNECLHDCMCAVAIHREGDSCWKKKLPLSNGHIAQSINGKALMKVPKGSLPPSSPIFPFPERRKKDGKSLITVESVLLIASLFFNCLLVTTICLGFFLIYRGKPRKISQSENALETNLRCFTYKEIIQATDGFKEELGRGAFGVVYKGMISNSPAAIKKLHTAEQESEKEFRNELNVIGQTHQKNLVRLIGFCDEGQEKLLVYEFMSNGSLAGLLFGKTKPSWKQRCQIAFDIARGLSYLHEECSTMIIHFDIKPENILLNDYYTAKISDFGLAKLLQLNQSRTHTAIKGTKGYLAPEWFRNSPVTAKVDVYSFGVLLLEIICCKKSLDSKTDGSGEGVILTDLAYDYYKEGRLDALLEGDIEALHDMDTLNKMVMIVIWCIQEEPSIRPSMRKISQMLEGALEVPLPPCPFLFSRTETTSL